MKTCQLKIEPHPDFRRLEKVLRREGEPDRVPFFELFSNITEPVLRSLGRWQNAPDGLSGKDWLNWHLDRHIEYQYTLGYDYVNVGGWGFGFPQKERPKTTTAEGERSYLQATTHTIANREEFQNYPWVDMSKVDYSPLENLTSELPPGMKAISLSSGVLENVMWLLGYEPFSLLLFDDEPLVHDMFDAVGSRITAYFDRCASFDSVGAICLGDDMGFKTQTMVSPAVLRRYVFPWHRQIVEAAHRHGKPAILHSCGNLVEVMDDIIVCGWDAKHSYEDQITPVWEVKQRWGDRIAVLGGFDMHRISRSTPDEVREHTRFLITQCAPGGGWALGTGNSVANYVPVENYLAMMEEGFACGGYGEWRMLA